MSIASDHAGEAAVTICEALLLALNDRGLLPEHESVGVLRGAAATRENAIGTEVETAKPPEVAKLINTILIDGNSAQRP